MPDYEAMKKELPGLKSKLTRALKTKNPSKVIEVATAALDRFEVIGYPDCWNNWNIAKSDAIFAKQRGLNMV